MRKFFVCVMVLGGCAVEPVDQVPTVSNVPRIGSNSLSPDAVTDSAITTVKLDADSAAAMADSPDALSVLSYAVGCALGADQSISFSVGGTAYDLAGSVGVAPAWTSRALSSDEAAWVSACVFARVNLTSVHVAISMRGANAGLATTAAELAAFQIEEGAFWGNVFVDVGAVAAYSCDGVDQATNDSYGDLPLRQCAQPDGTPGSNLSPCGMHYAGLCTAVCASASPYANCSFQGATAVADVMTTFLLGSPQ